MGLKYERIHYPDRSSDILLAVEQSSTPELGVALLRSSWTHFLSSTAVFHGWSWIDMASGMDGGTSDRSLYDL